MARGAGRRHRWLSAALLGGIAAGAAAAEAPADARTARAGVPAATPKGTPVAKAEATKAPPPHAPAAELLDWLGRYAESDEGIDPLGLADLDADGAHDRRERQP